MSMRGYDRLRAKLRKLPDEVNANIRPVMRQAGTEMLATMEELTPVDTGRLERSESFKVSGDGMSVQIGLTTTATERKAFYLHYLDQGTKGYAKHNIPPMPALHILDRTYDAHATDLKDRVRSAINQTLQAAASNV